ncbi:hypothetical protein [Streptomyces sp. NPDC016845]|uniref:hypothetical protein n=1 Tax=Streptomyces sp. NPDC016845 TaxID=3364972 RepID=UPI0037B69A68
MTLYTAAVFENGMVAKLLDILVAARTASPQVSERDEIDRVNRLLSSSASVATAMPSATLSALVDLIAEEVSARPDDRLSKTFTEKLEVATVAAGTDVSTFLADTALALRTSQRAGIRRFDDLPLSKWEAEAYYARLHDFAWWVEGDEYDTFEDGVLAGVASEHPYGCAYWLPQLISECHAALLLEGDSASVAALRSLIPWATAPVVREVLRHSSTHLLEAH